MQFNRWCQCIVVMLIVAVTVTEGSSETIDLVSKDSGAPSIVVGETVTDKEAAHDLADYLTRVTGQPVSVKDRPGSKVVFHVGADNFAREYATEIEGLFADGFVIKGLEIDGRYHLILAGKIEPSSQWAVEQFLKDYCGVRWLFPHPKYGEVVPARSTIAVERDLNRIIEPDYLSRANMGMYYYSPAKSQLRNGSFGYEYGAHAIQHIFDNGAESDDIFEQHPEWFALSGGKRQWWKYGNGWQICTSNPETVAHTVQYIDQYFKRMPDAPMVSVGPNDGAGWCKCESCKAVINSYNPPLNVSERWFLWTNQVAAAVAKSHPGKWVEALAYGETSPVPRFALEPNVAVTKTFVTDGEMKQAEEWSRVCKSVNLYSYMYGNSFLGFRHYPHAARDFLKWGYDKVGALAHVSECGGDWTFDGPKYYYMQILQWDVNADLNAIMNDYCVSAYGEAAAKPMRAFWDRLEEIYERRRPVPYGEHNRRFYFYQWVGWTMNSYVQPNDEFREYMPADIEYLDNCMNESLAAVGGVDEGERYRLDRMAEAWRFYRTALVSYTRFYDLKPQKVGSTRDLEDAMKTVSEIADLRAEREQMLGAMRMHPAVNPHTTGTPFWGWNEGLVIFNREITLVDAICTEITRYLKTVSGDAAIKHWELVSPSSPLHTYAQTQLHTFTDTLPSNVIANGDFEEKSLAPWEAVGNVSITPSRAVSGNFIVQLSGEEGGEISQQIAVKPTERYHLSAHCRYVSTAGNDAVPLESYIDFYNHQTRLDREPMRTVMSSADPGKGWQRLEATITVPAGATRCIVRLKRPSTGVAQWDNVQLRKILSADDLDDRQFRESFATTLVNSNHWFQSTGSGGVRPPQTHDGWLVFNDPSTYPLTSYLPFTSLLSFDGDEAYQLQLRIGRVDMQEKSAIDFAIQANTGTIRTNVSGLYWTHSFMSAGMPATIYSYAAQDKTVTQNGTYPLTLPPDAKDICYTLKFDTKRVSIYAATGDFISDESHLVASYEHGITNIASGGDIYLKVDGRNCRIRDLSLVSSAPRSDRKSPIQPSVPENDPTRLIMPGVSDK